MNIKLLVFGIGISAVSAIGLFASNEKLVGMAGIIGTKNPKVARIVCVIGLVLGIVTLVSWRGRGERTDEK